MKLLIVEDEEAALMGLSTMLDWKQSGISQVLLASNGEAGLAAAKENSPDIILTDIRMPRMDGISMAKKIRSILPDAQIIFLTAYQEIDYYRAAIQLKAVNYIEKPVLAEDLEKAVSEAVANIRKNSLLQKAEGAKQKRIREAIAHQLLLPGKTLTKEQTEYLEKKGMLKALTNGYLSTVLIWLHDEASNDSGLLMQLICRLAAVPVLSHMEILGARHDHNCLALHFFAEGQDMFFRHRMTIADILGNALKDFPYYYITMGKTVRGLPLAFTSWQSATILLQEIFYDPYRSVRIYDRDNRSVFTHSLYQQEKEGILHAIADCRQAEILRQEENLVQKLKKERNILPVNVRNMYAAFFYDLGRQAEILHLTAAKEALSPELWNSQISWANLDALHGLFLQKTAALFEAIEENRGQQSLVRQIHAYIEQNYSNDLLSLKEISNYVCMSNSHMCTYYKQETGRTINQYLTQVRLDKAKYYLKTTNYSISDIALRVGYRESSYFGRIFKKTYDITPAEYREQCKELK